MSSEGDLMAQAERAVLTAEQREDVLRNALSHIALKAIPCGICGAVHVRRHVGSRVTLADPDDGHHYVPMPVEAYAKATLAKVDRAGEGGS